MKKTTKRTARIFFGCQGYNHCDDSLDYLDDRGGGWPRKLDALISAYENGYTHAVGSGAYRAGSILGQIPRTHPIHEPNSASARSHEDAACYLDTEDQRRRDVEAYLDDRK